MNLKKYQQNYLSIGIQIVLCILSEANLILQPDLVTKKDRKNEIKVLHR